MSPWTYAIQVEFANYREEQEIWRILQEAGYNPHIVRIRK